MKWQVTLIASLFAGAAFAHDDDSGGRATQKVGKVNFPSSCSAQVQPKVQRAVAMLHSFWWPEGERAFQEIGAEDPSCTTIAAWGFASILMYNPLVGIVPPKDIERAQAAIAKGREAGAKSPRE